MNLPDLKNKIVFITGSDKGLGRKFVENFSINGADIISCSIKKVVNMSFFARI